MKRKVESTSSNHLAPESTDVAVVGGGLVGLAFALAAAQSGLQVVLFGPGISKSTKTAPSGELGNRVYALSPSTREFLEQLHVWDELDAERIGVVHDMRVFAGSIERSELHFSAYQAATAALAWIVEHDALVATLGAALRFQANIHLIDAPLSSLAVGESGVVVSDGVDQVQAQLVVGADGIDSFVRSLSGLAGEPRSLHATGVVANFGAEHGHRNCALQWFTRDGVIALLPMAGDVVSLVWSAPNALAQSLEQGSPNDLAARLAPYTFPSLGQLTPVSALAAFPLQRLSVPLRIGPRVALIGDAAHVIHPLAGQGLNLGFDDARVLAQILAEREPYRGCGDERLLRRFERRRKEAVHSMGAVTDGLHWLFSGRAGPLDLMAAPAMGLLNRLPMKAHLMRHALQNGAL